MGPHRTHTLRLASLRAEREPVDTASAKHSRRGHNKKPSFRARSAHFRANLADFPDFGPLPGANLKKTPAKNV